MNEQVVQAPEAVTTHEGNTPEAIVKTPDLDAIPTKEWTLDELGAFARALARRTAVDIWRTGRAISYAKGSVRKRQWGKWCERWLDFLSRSTIYRYLEVSTLQLDTVEDKTVKEVYVLLGFIKADELPPKEDTEGKPEQDAPEADTDTDADEPTPEPDVQGQDEEDTGMEDDADLRRAEELAHEIVTGKPKTYKHAVSLVKDIGILIGADWKEEDLPGVVETALRAVLVELTAKVS